LGRRSEPTFFCPSQAPFFRAVRPDPTPSLLYVLLRRLTAPVYPPQALFNMETPAPPIPFSTTHHEPVLSGTSCPSRGDVHSPFPCGTLNGISILLGSRRVVGLPWPLPCLDRFPYAVNRTTVGQSCRLGTSADACFLQRSVTQKKSSYLGPPPLLPSGCRFARCPPFPPPLTSLFSNSPPAFQMTDCTRPQSVRGSSLFLRMC